MTVRDLCELFDYFQEIEIYDISTQEVQFEGSVDEVASSDYFDEEIMSIDALEKGSNVLTLNIETNDNDVED